MTELDFLTLRRKDCLFDGLGNRYIVAGKAHFHGECGGFITIMVEDCSGNGRYCLSVSKEKLGSYDFARAE